MGSGARKRTVVDAIVDAVASEILTGEYAPGSQLPSIRKLATLYDVTPPTAQRVVARLAELGLIDTRHGSGMTVRDPLVGATLAVMPRLVRACESDPPLARRVLADFLELRRILSVRTVVALATGITDDELGVLEQLVTELEHAPVEDGREACCAADLAISRKVLELRPQAAFSMVTATFDELIERSRALRMAMYRDPAVNAAAYRAAFSMVTMSADHAELGRVLETLMIAFDAELLHAYERLLEEAAASA